ncbi:WYL domain-containing protein [Klebsiella quasivariicola]|uniref:WYL domain-containing protein n=1 Tax=Klebsiella quasivariicola TaxID=2026240 RepID=UPI0020212028|nr:WYL domain-containing protein [Klebsiella quasivariicola]MCL7690076.1 WYL domain-containing protein [Klebsiella quasivariicola]
MHQGHTQSAVAPYRLICLDGKWYLVAVSKERIQVFTLSSITDVVMTVSGFVRNSHTSRIFQDPRFIRKRTAITVLTNGGYLVGSTMRHGSSSLTRFTGQSAMTSRIW